MRPKVYEEDHKLICETSAWGKFLGLGLYFRQITLDPQKRELIIATRVFWKTTRQYISFDWVTAILYDDAIRSTYTDGGRYNSIGDVRETDYESILLRLVLKNGDQVKLWKFRGVAGVSYGDIFTGDVWSARAFEDTIEPTAKWLAQCLGYYMQVPISKSLNV